MASLANNTLANPKFSFYAPAGESARNWYQYPALNGTVLLADTSGVQTLQAIGGDLFFNGELLAKAGDIQDIAAWSDYPAINNVNMDGFSLLDVSGLTVNNGATLGSLLVSNGITSEANITTATLQIAGAAVPSLGQITTSTLAASGLIQAGSVTSTGAISGTAVSGTSLATSGGLDMANTAVTRASSVGISNSGFAPYGSLTSPDGVMLTWNGSQIQTGGAGSASTWANYPAINTINAATNNIINLGSLTATDNITTTGNISATSTNSIIGANYFVGGGAPTSPPVTLRGSNGVQIQALTGNVATTTTVGDITATAFNNYTVNSGNDISLTSDAGLSPLITSTVNLTAQNGNGGQLNLVANPGSVAAFGGKVTITANGGTVYVPQDPPAPPIAVTVGGEVDITANTGSPGLYTLTSSIKLGAAGINSYAGAIPAVGSLAGYNFIYGSLGVNICAGIPSSGFQFPTTVYLYGVGTPGLYGGVRLESPQGIQMLSDTYITNLYPLDTNGLHIEGRSFLGAASVYIQDLAQLTMNSSTAIDTDGLQSVSGNGITTLDVLIANQGINTLSIKPTPPSSLGSPNLVISGNSFASYTNYVDISDADVIAFAPAATGSITGVKSINGAVWPPATGDASLWSQYPATSAVDMSGYGMTNLASIGALNGFTLTSAGSIGIFADTSGGNLTLSTNGGGNVSIGTGNAGNISIQTVGAGHNLTMAGDTVMVTSQETMELISPTGILFNTPIIDAGSADINNVLNISGVPATTFTVTSELDVVVEGATDAYLVATAGSANIRATAGTVNIVSPAVNFSTTTIDVSSAIIKNAKTITGDGTQLTINNTGTGSILISDTSGSIVLSSQYAATIINGGTNVNLNATAGPINLNANTVVNINKPTTVTGTLSATVDVVSSSAGSTPYSLNTIGALVSGNQQYNYWVAVNGSDSTGTGSSIRPFASVTAALAATVSISDTIPVNICLTAGTYTENPTMTRNNTFIQGSVGIADCVIVGTFTFNSSSSSTISQGLTGVTVVGNVVCSETASVDTNWYIQNCNITSYGTVALAATSTGAGNNALILYNTVVTQNVTANPAISINTVRLNAIQSQINNSTTGSSVACSGTGSMSLFGVTMTCAGSATASPVIAFTNLTSNGTASSFALCTFTYTAATAGSGKTAVFFNNAGALAGLTLFNQNVFNMLGSTSLILRPGAGSVAIQWGTNSSNITTIPAAGAGLTYTYLPSTPLRANALYDSASSAGTASQVLTASSGGGSLLWSSLGASSLGALAATPAASAYRNSIALYDTSTNAISYDTNAYSVVVQAAPATVALATTMRGRTYIVTSTGLQIITFTTLTLTANDTGFFILVKNGNPTGGGDITIAGATGNVTVHNKTATTSGGVGYVVWNGTALVAY